MTYLRKFCYLLIGLAWLLVTQTAAGVGLAPKHDLSQYRTLFLHAESALARNNIPLFQKLKKQLVDYPLYPYLRYSELERRIQTVTFEELQDFIFHYEDTPLVEPLRNLWLHNQARQKNWQDYLKAYTPTEDLALQCHYLWAQLQTERNDKAILSQVLPLWLFGKSHPKSCEPLFNTWQEHGYMTRPMLWQRIKLAIQEGNGSLARQLGHYLKRSERDLIDLWLRVHHDPFLVRKQGLFQSQHPANLEIIVHGVSLIAKKKPESALSIWQQINKRYPFTERHWGLVVRAIGLSYAHNKHPDADKWLEKVPSLYANQPVHEWRIRVALAKDQWGKVLKWIESLPPQLAKLEEWQYWQARALEKNGKHKEAREVYEKIAPFRSYYGFLASQRLLKPFSLAHSKAHVESGLMQKVMSQAGIQRARELYLLNRHQRAKSEWRHVTQRLKDKEKQAAATIALQWNLPNWSILALSQAIDKNALELRFPTFHSKNIFSEASRHRLDPAWVFAITRQESAFVTNARSSSGAMGLMQLIPSTAHMVAKRQSHHFKHPDELFNADTNIRLGSPFLNLFNSLWLHPGCVAYGCLIWGFYPAIADI